MNTVDQRPLSQAIHDYCVLTEMRDTYRRHLQAARLECSALSRDLKLLDADEVMQGIDGEFDPLSPVSGIGDCFVNAFHKADSVLKDAGAEPIGSKATTPAK